MTPFPKTIPLRDPKYLAWLRTLPCVVCGLGPCEAAHQRLLGGGTSSKPDDRYALPYCFACHHGVEHNLNGGILTLWNQNLPGNFEWTREELRDHLRILCEYHHAEYLAEKGV
jgi:hypothetical protein